MKKYIKEIIIAVLLVAVSVSITLTVRYKQVLDLQQQNAQMYALINNTRNALMRDTKNARNQNLVNYFNAIGWNIPNIPAVADSGAKKD